MDHFDNTSPSLHPMLSALSPLRMKKGKIVTVSDAVNVIRNGDTVATGGFVGIGFAEEIAIAIENHFLANNTPRDLTLVYAAGQGDGGEKGLNHFGHPGLVKKVIGGHWGLAPKLQKLAIDNQIIAYNLPQGVISHLYRDIAAHKPRTITTVGLNTFVDPRHGGGKLNAMTVDDIVEPVVFDGKPYLAYKTFPINVAILRGTTADTFGNITTEKEALTLESIAIAMAAKNSNGFVIVQVERVAEGGSFHPRRVTIPGILVDCVVVAKPENHWQTFSQAYNPAFSGEIKLPAQSIDIMPMDERKIIARRAAFELKANSVINLGIGMPEGIAQVANEEKILSYLTMTAEPGLIGGVPAGGLNFGAGTNADAIIDQPYQFDFYDGGGLDIAFLGLAQADQQGNLNVSKFGPKLAGSGGFINISQNAKKVVFVGTFTAKGLAVRIDDAGLSIIKEGKTKKFVETVEQVTFSGAYAALKKQPVLFITERCVFKLTPDGLVLTEIAPGIDLEKDIIALMDFKPLMPEPPALMDQRIFQKGAMGLKDMLLSRSLEDRLFYNASKNIFFVNFEGYAVRSIQQIAEIEALVRNILEPVGGKVYTIVNYDNFSIPQELIDDYTDMVKRLVTDLYSGVSRYTTSTFLRMKLGKALAERNVAPHIFDSVEEIGKTLEMK